MKNAKGTVFKYGDNVDTDVINIISVFEYGDNVDHVRPVI